MAFLECFGGAGECLANLVKRWGDLWAGRDVHRHKCHACGFIWEHDGLTCAGDYAAHRCPCGERVGSRHDDDSYDVPQYVGNGKPRHPGPALSPAEGSVRYGV